MHQSFILEEGRWFLFIGLIGASVGVVFFMVKTARLLIVLRRGGQRLGENGKAIDWVPIYKYTMYRIIGRIFMLAVTCVFFGLLWRNAFLQFNAVTIEGSKVTLHYPLRKERHCELSEVDFLKLVREQNGGYLEVALTNGECFRSVLVHDKSLLDRLESLNSTRQSKPSAN